MHTYPSLPRVENAPDALLQDGHLWILEKVDGAHLRFQLRDTGVIRFGDRDRVYMDPAEIPEPYRHAVRHVRERLDREALRNAASDVEDVVFFGEATHRHTIDYDWDRTPSFLGFDVWSAAAGGFLPPDSVESILGELGLDAVHAVDREVRARDFDPDSYTIPGSAYYDGPAEGVVIRDKAGHRGMIQHPEFRDGSDFGFASGSAPGSAPDDPVSDRLDADAAADRFVTRRRFETIATRLAETDREVTFDALYDRVLEDVARRQHHLLYAHPRPVDLDAFRAVVAARTRRFLDDR
ncbi:RNA ligase family protein [Halopenitus sp. POP-27]|uniref:RNA ligase family protein n=1 Tax=Halopenitus sp. POP-27 TaxID=2994425 RepID=UPI0024698F2F|nr:RNA ligase family protein [Halopenitus sp. POP-27]